MASSTETLLGRNPSGGVHTCEENLAIGPVEARRPIPYRRRINRVNTGIVLVYN